MAVALTVAFWAPSRAETPQSDPREICLGGIHGPIDHSAFIAACTRLLETNNTEPEDRAMALANRGEMYIATSQLDLALQDCLSAAKVAPREVMTGKLCGDVYLFKGDPDAAIGYYTRSIRGTSQFLHGLWMGRIQAYLAAKRYDDALDDADYFVQRAKTDSNAYALRGQVHFQRGEYRPALDDFEQALRLDPTSAEAEDGRNQAKSALTSH